VAARGRSGAGTDASAAAPHRVALTFDAEHPDRRATPGVQERLLETLDRLGVTATFFIQGRWAEAYPATAARIAAAGHLIGNHSHYHARMPHLSDDGLRYDIAAADAVIRQTTGVDPKPWFRTPFGAGCDDPRVLGALRTAGYHRHVGWTVEGYDWEPDRPVEELVGAIADGLLARQDGIALLHTWPDRTEAAIPGIVDRLRDAGATLVTVDALETVAAGVSGPTLPERDPA
jgi:peptidoglycan/xylan/chitin deacetylase (PgdA/CDA1 family)